MNPDACRKQCLNLNVHTSGQPMWDELWKSLCQEAMSVLIPSDYAIRPQKSHKSQQYHSFREASEVKKRGYNYFYSHRDCWNYA